ncbi:MAG: sodium:solute symporter family protein [Planctomycetota bacterium]|jgi:SSS family solute:Na+ symporter
MFSTNFTNIDWTIVAAYLLVVTAAGVIANRFIHNVGNYMVGGRASGTALNTATFIGGFTALVSIVYGAQDGFAQGFTYMMVGFIAMLACGFFGVTGLVIKNLRKMSLTTIPEYFEVRYSRCTRVIAAVICAFAGILNMGLFPKMGAVFITYSTGLANTQEDPAMLVNIVTSVLIILVLLYTILGGMVSVIITDFIQFLMMAVGMAIGLYYCFTYTGLGWDNMVDTMADCRGEKAFNPFHESSYGWMYMLWMVCSWSAAAIAWAPEATRALTAKDPATSKRTFLFATPAWFVSMAVPALWGIAAFTLISNDAGLSSYFLPNGPSGDAGQYAAEAMPLVLGKIIPTGLLGILLAGMMATFMSTHDSYFLCWASVIVRDIINPLRSQPLSNVQQIRATRIVIAFIGVFLLVFGIWIDIPESVWTYMAITGAIYLSGAGIVLAGGIYWPRASTTGAIAALFGGLVSVTALFEKPIQQYEQFEWVSAELICLSNYALCIILFVAFSLLFPDNRKNINGEL